MEAAPLAPGDPRISVPLFTSREAARYVRVPVSTMRNWVQGYDFPVHGGVNTSPAIVASLDPAKRGYPSIPFVGLAEALVLAAFRRRGLSLQKIRAALTAIQMEITLPHVLANQALYTDGADVLWDFAKSTGDKEVGDLVEPSSGQRVFTEAVRQYLDLITYDAQHWASLIALPAFSPAEVVVDMNRGFGRPILARHRVRLEDITDRFFFGGMSIDEIMADLELERPEVENVIRAARPASAAA